MHLWLVLALSCAVAALHHIDARWSGDPSDARETALVGAVALVGIGWWVSVPALVGAAVSLL